jgi:biopolymer transport protein TolR
MAKASSFSQRRHAAVAEINMTPFIDVVLVLLIIFMVSAPLLTSGVPLDLPQTQAKPLAITHKPVTLSLNEKGDLFVDETLLDKTHMVEKIRELTHENTEERIYLRADKRVLYGQVAHIMTLITNAGFKKVALITEHESST